MIIARLFIGALLVATMCTGCKDDSAKTKVTVTQRTHLPQNKLQLHYTFTANNKVIKDSVVTANRVINDDSLMVSFKQAKPEEHNLLIP